MTAQRLAVLSLLAVCLVSSSVHASRYDEYGSVRRGLYTAVAVVANVVPVVPTFFAPRCLPGYVVCKASFAAMSVIAALDQLVFSGGGDPPQTRAILHRGFRGDWFLTGRHVAGDVSPEPLPEPPAPPADGGGWQPPPL